MIQLACQSYTAIIMEEEVPPDGSPTDVFCSSCISTSTIREQYEEAHKSMAPSCNNPEQVCGTFEIYPSVQGLSLTQDNLGQSMIESYNLAHEQMTRPLRDRDPVIHPTNVQDLTFGICLSRDTLQGPDKEGPQLHSGRKFPFMPRFEPTIVQKSPPR